MTRRGIISAFGAGAGLLLAGCSGLFGTTTLLRYRITITFDTPEGLKSGTAVQEIRDFDPYGGFRPICLGSHEITGDAVVLNVYGRTFFFGMTQCSNRVGDALHIGDWQPRSAKVRGSFAEEARELKARKATVALSAPVYEKFRGGGFKLFSFDDLSDFASMKINGFEPDNPEWSIVRVDITPTADRITYQAQERLTWLNTLDEEDVRQSRLNQDYAIRNILSNSSALENGS